MLLCQLDQSYYFRFSQSLVRQLIEAHASVPADIVYTAPNLGKQVLPTALIIPYIYNV